MDSGKNKKTRVGLNMTHQEKYKPDTQGQEEHKEGESNEEYQAFEEEVDKIASKKKKRKTSPAQLEALSAGRKKRWALNKKSSSRSVAPLETLEEKPSEVETSPHEEVKSDNTLSDSDRDSDSEEKESSYSASNHSVSSDLSGDTDSSDSGDSDDSIDKPSEAALNKKQNVKERSSTEKNEKAARKMSKYIERQMEARRTAPSHLFL